MGSQTMQALAISRLDDAIGLVCSVPEACARDPARDFTRGRKLGLRELLWLIVTMGTDTLRMELMTIDYECWRYFQSLMASNSTTAIAKPLIYDK